MAAEGALYRRYCGLYDTGVVTFSDGLRNAAGSRETPAETQPPSLSVRRRCLLAILAIVSYRYRHAISGCTRGEDGTADARYGLRRELGGEIEPADAYGGWRLRSRGESSGALRLTALANLQLSYQHWQALVTARPNQARHRGLTAPTSAWRASGHQHCSARLRPPMPFYVHPLGREAINPEALNRRMPTDASTTLPEFRQITSATTTVMPATRLAGSAHDRVE